MADNKYGIFGALVIIAIMLSIYFVSPEMYIGAGAQWLIVLAYIPFMWWALQAFVKPNQNLDFRLMLKPPFLTFILINLGFYLLMYGLFLADKTLPNILAQREIAVFEAELAQGAGDPQKSNEIRQRLEYLKSHGMEVALMPLLLRMCIGAMGGFGLSALLVLFHQSRSK